MSNTLWAKVDVPPSGDLSPISYTAMNKKSMELERLCALATTDYVCIQIDVAERAMIAKVLANAGTERRF
jgi:hypothetical protein